MGCNCGKSKCDGNCGVSPTVLQINNPSECTLFHKVIVPAAMGTSVENPPKNGAYRNTLLVYEADGMAFLYSSDGIPTVITGVSSDYNLLNNKPQINGVTLEGDKSLTELGITSAINDAVTAGVEAEAALRIAADDDLQQQIDTIAAASDVVDIVGTYADLQAYDTQHLHDNDIIKVLSDGTHGDAISYYRFNKTSNTWSYIGSQGPYYTMFYANVLENGSTRHIYKDNAFTTAVSAADVINAAQSGGIILSTTTAANPDEYSLMALENVWVYPNDIQFSFTDGTYVANYLADLQTDTSFQYSKYQLQYKLTAGNGIDITGTTISGMTASVSETTLILNNA